MLRQAISCILALSFVSCDRKSADSSPASAPAIVETTRLDLARTPDIVEVVGITDANRLETLIPARFAAAGAIGKMIHVVMDATGEKCVGVIQESAPLSEASDAELLVQIELRCHQPLQSGMQGRAQLLVGERFALFVTKSALRKRDNQSFVYVAESGHARLRQVTTGQEYLGAVEILDGLKAGDVVITEGPDDLTDGAPLSTR